MALIQRTDVERSHYDTAWTVYFLQNALVAIGLFSLSGLAAEYFQEPRVVPMMQVLSVGILFSGLQNIGVVNFRKNLQFSKEFTFMVTTKLGSFVVTIGLAVWLRNYWALIWGVVSLRVISVIMSYAMHPYRPRVSLSRFSELWSFSQWMLVRNIGMYLRTQIDTLLVARFFSTDRVGYYSVSKEIAELPTTEIIWPMARALYPGYAKLSENSSNLGSAYLKVLNSISMICIPSGFGLALVAEPLVALVFGDRWMPIVPVLTWLAIYGIILTLSSSVQSPLIALGQMRRVAAITWAQLLVAVPAILFVVRLDNLEWIALTQVLTALLIMPIFFASIITTGVVDMRGVARAVAGDGGVR
jgi:O-antigen/teichoic acid export membrane protein